MCDDASNTCPVYSEVTRRSVVHSECWNAIHNSQLTHEHTITLISLHQSVKYTNTNRGSYPLNVSAGSDSLGLALLSELSTLWTPSPSFFTYEQHHTYWTSSVALGIGSILGVMTKRTHTFKEEHEPQSPKNLKMSVNVQKTMLGRYILHISVFIGLLILYLPL